jgi:molybdate transport system substrate-binding protein
MIGFMASANPRHFKKPAQLASQRARWLIALFLGVWAVTAAAAEPVKVLAAFTLKPALDEIAAAYRQSGGEVTLVYGPSPELAQQIESGEPADLFFSADPIWTDELVKQQLVTRGAVSADFLGNHLVLIGKKGTPPTALNGGIALIQLLGPGPLAMCDPDSHPAGRMAKASLTQLGLWDAVEKKVARTENPLLAVKMVARGDAPYAIVFATDAMTDPGVAVIATFPDDSHPPIRYPVAILAKSANPDAARFLDDLLSPQSAEIFKRFGYVTRP